MWWLHDEVLQQQRKGWRPRAIRVVAVSVSEANLGSSNACTAPSDGGSIEPPAIWRVSSHTRFCCLTASTQRAGSSVAVLLPEPWEWARAVAQDVGGYWSAASELINLIRAPLVTAYPLLSHGSICVRAHSFCAGIRRYFMLTH